MSWADQLSAARAGAVQEALKQLTASLVALNLALFAKGALTEEELRDGIRQAEALGALGKTRSPALQAAEEKFRPLLEGE